ncbi:PKD domain-containing protein [Aliiroseovarius halocynthiae]|nr:FG-GAP-like repeat-containing protein [Aliiroseovarius halocynthiae]
MQPISADVGDAVQLDPTDGLNIPFGNAATFEWSWSERPTTSVSGFSDSSAIRPSIVIDVPGRYVAHVAVRDVDDPANILASGTLEVTTDNTAPTARIIARGMPEGGSTLVLDGTPSTDVDGARLTYAWTLESAPVGSGAQFATADTPLAKLQMDVEGTYTAGLVVTDAIGQASTQATYNIDFFEDDRGRQVAPTASARFDQIRVQVGETTYLEPYASTDIDGSLLAADIDVLVAPSGAVPQVSTDEEGMTSLTFDVAGEYLVAYEVRDDARAAQDQVLIIVGQGGNLRPVANIQPITSAVMGAPVTLDGTQSYDLDGDAIQYRWSLLHAPANSVAGIVDASSSNGLITPDVEGDYVVQLVVTDGASNSVPQTYLMQVEDSLPVAHAGPDLPFVGAGAYQLDAGLSSADPTVPLYAWRLIGGTGLDRATLTGTDTEVIGVLDVASQSDGQIDSAQFRDVLKAQNVYHDWDYNDMWANTPRPADGNLCRFSLWQRFDTAVEDVTVSNDAVDQSQGDILPGFSSEGYVTDDAGTKFAIWRVQYQRRVARVFRIELEDGSWSEEFVLLPGTDAYIRAPYSTSTAKLYVSGDLWRQASPNPNPFQRIEPVCLNDGRELPFSAVAQVIVGDEGGVSAPKTMFIGSGNLRPALARGQSLTANIGEAVDLNGAHYGIDPNGDTLTFNWSLIARPDGSVVTIGSDPADVKVTGNQITFTPDRSGQYLVQLEAYDGALMARPAVIAIEVLNTAPVAVVAAPAEVFVGDTASIDGTGSYDPENNALNYKWTLVSQPAGSSAAIADRFAPAFSFTPDRRGDYVFELVVSDYELESIPAIVTVTAPNRLPVAVLDGPVNLNVGEEAAFDATGSSDLDNDTLTYVFEVVQQPTGSNPVVADLGNGNLGFAGDRPGQYTLQVTVSDGLAEATSTLDVSVLTLNRPPVLSELRDVYTVELGLEFALDLEGSDPDADPISFFATPLPLTQGIALDAASGQIRFRPEEGQLGTYSFTVGVSDGALTDNAVLTIEVVEASAGETTVHGRVLDAVEFAVGVELPLAGMPVRLQDAALMTTTDADGNFSFGSLVGGGDQIIVEPTANGGPGGYLGAARAIQITENQIRDLDPEFLLTPLSDGCAPVVAGVDTTLTGSASNLFVSISADSIQTSSGDPYTGEVCLGSLPQLFDDPGLPSDTQACNIYALDAPGAVFTQGVTVRAPNADLLPEGTELALWRKGVLSGRYSRLTNASVDGGGATVSATAPSFSDGTLFSFLPQAPRTRASADQPTGNSMLSPFSGDVNQNYMLPGYTAFGQTQNVGLSYHSQAANPTVIVAGDVTIADDASLPVTLSTRLDIGGLSVSDSAQWTPRSGQNGQTPALVGEELTLRQSMPLDGSGIDSGRYGYRFVAKAHYACSTVAARHDAELHVLNETDSPYGNGWSIDGLQKLVVGGNGKVSIVDDDGVATFNPQPTLTSFEDEPFVFPTVGTQGVRAADFDGDGDIDVVYGESGTGSIGTIINVTSDEWQQAGKLKVANPNDVPQTGHYPPNLTNIAIGELNNDESTDVAYSLQLQEGYGYAANNGNAVLTKEFEALGVGRRPLDIAVADIDQDGYDDIIYVAVTSLLFWVSDEVWVSYGGPGAREVVRVSHRYFSGAGTLQLEIADIDGDGRDDIAYRTRGGVDFVFNNGNRSYSTYALRAGGGGVNLLGEYFKPHDFNQDGFMDFVYSKPDSLQVVLNTTGRSFATPVELARPAGASGAMPVHLADANGDGFTDIVATVGSQIYVYNSNGDGTFQPHEAGLVEYGIGDVAIADLNNDGSLDLVSEQRFSVTVHYSKPSATGNFVAGDGEFSELTRNPDGSWQRRYKDGVVVEFDIDGRQTATVDPQGNRKTYTYGAEGRVAEITDQVGGITAFTYQADGRLQSISYPDGRITEFSYDDVGNLNEVTEPTGSKVSFSYDENGRLVSSTNQNGNTTGYSYDAVGNLRGAKMPDSSSVATQIASSLGLIDGLGGPATQPLVFVEPEDRVTTVTDRKGQVTTVEVNQFGSVVRTVDPLGREARIMRDDQNLATQIERPSDATASGVRIDTIAYDNVANVKAFTEAVGTPAERVTQYEYEPIFNKVTQQTDADGFVTSYEYDNTGQTTKIVNPEGGERLFSYETDGKLASRTDENGNVTSFVYNAARNIETTTYADGSITALTYDSAGNTTSIAEAQGTAVERQVHRTYDAYNRVLTVEVTGADGAQIDGLTSYSYLPAGNLATTTDATGLVTSMSYDAMERLVSVDDPVEGLIQRAYNVAGEVVSHTNGDGETHTYAYDATSRLTKTTDPEGFEKDFTYDTSDNVATVTDGRGGQTSFGYDPLNRMTKRTNPIGETMTRAYDARGNLSTLTREDGLVEAALYDGLGRRTRVETPDNVLTYAYDARSNLTEATDTDSSVTFTYDTRNRLSSTRTDGTAGLQPQVTLSYTYDALDRRTTMSDSLGGATTYAYDPEDRLTDLTAPWGTVYSFGYDGEGRRTSLTSTSGRASTYGYTNGLLTALSHVQTGVALTELTYQYGPDGQLTAIVDQLDPTKSKFISYDTLNRLVQVDQGIPPTDGGAPIPVEDYAYDAEGNRTASHLSALYAANDHNQLLEDDSYTYAYDTRGNRTSRTAKADGAVERYAYDSQNRLIGYGNDTLTVRYAYDALDRRIGKIIDGPDADISPAGEAENYALNLTGQEGIDIPDLVLDGPFTIESWIRLEAGINSSDGPVSSGDGQPTQDLNFAYQRLRLYSPGSGAVDKVAASTAAPTGVWTHYAVTRDAAGTLKVYMNGALDATGTAPFTLPFHVGRLGQTSAGTSHAQFDDLRIWSVARTEAQIAATRATYLSPGTTGLERLYRFDSDQAQVVDATGNTSPSALGAGATFLTSTAPTKTLPAAPPAPGPDAEVTAFVYDMSAANPLAHDDIVLEYSDDILTRRWLHSDAVDEPVGFEEYTVSSGVGSGQERSMFADRQGSVIWVTDPAAGTALAAYEYDGYGQITQTQGTLSQPYGYTGREYDAESGLYHYRARAYDPASGVFLQSDPIGFVDGLNTYHYVSSNTFNNIDPLGLMAVSHTSQAKGEDKNRKSALPPIAYGIGALAASISDTYGSIKLVDLPEHVRNNYPGAGAKAGPAGDNDPICLAAKERVRQAKAFRGSVGGSCTEKADALNALRYKAARQEAFARQYRDTVCPMDPKVLLTKGVTPLGEKMAKVNAFGHMARCRAILSLYGVK